MLTTTIKRIFDIVAGASLILALSPVLIAISVAIAVETPGGVFFRQLRLGKGARAFSMYKFRSMVKNAEKMDEGLFNYADDPRVTRVGKFLRATSLDELPQLINVVIGEMSLVGPRPPVSYELGEPSEFDARTRRRFDVRPGITGLAQVSGRNELSWDQKIEHDNRYIEMLERFGVLYDLPILARTIAVVFGNSGAHEIEENREVDASRMNADDPEHGSSS